MFALESATYPAERDTRVDSAEGGGDGSQASESMAKGGYNKSGDQMAKDDCFWEQKGLCLTLEALQRRITKQ